MRAAMVRESYRRVRFERASREIPRAAGSAALGCGKFAIRRFAEAGHTLPAKKIKRGSSAY